MDLGIDLGAQAVPAEGAPAPSRGAGGDALAALFAAFVAERLAQAGGSRSGPPPAAPPSRGSGPRQEATAPDQADGEEDDATGSPAAVDVLSIAGLDAAAVVRAAEPQQQNPSAEITVVGAASADAVAGDDQTPADPQAVPSTAAAQAAAVAASQPASSVGDGAADADAKTSANASGSSSPPAAAVGAAVTAGQASAPADAAIQDALRKPGASDGGAPSPPVGAAPATAPAEHEQAVAEPRRSLSPAGRALARALGVLTPPSTPRQDTGAAVATTVAADGATPPEPVGDVRSSATAAPPNAAPLVGASALRVPTAAGRDAVDLGSAAAEPASAAALSRTTSPVSGSAATSLPAAPFSRNEGSPGDTVTAAARSAAGSAESELLRAAPAAPSAGVANGQAAQASSDGSISLASATPLEGGDDQQELAVQLVKAIRLQVRDGIGTAKLQLRPEHLGEVNIELTVSKDRLTAVVHAERADVRAQIEAQAPALRAGLSGAGLHLEELTVRDDAPQRDGSGGRERAPEEHLRRRRERTDKEFVLVA